MKRTKIYLWLCWGILLAVACSQSKEDIIKGEFKKYVSENFDNPKDLKEILEIKAIDTISYGGLKNGAILMYGVAEQIDSLVELEHTQCNSIVNKIRGQKPIRGDYERSIMQEWLGGTFELNNDMITWIDLYFDETKYLKNTIDSLLEQTKGLSLLEYEIKTRVKDGDNLKIKTYYALEDSVSIRFFGEKPTFDDYSEPASAFYKAAKRYEDLYAIRREIVTRKLDLHKRMRSILE
jgi:hypothetical protein